MKKITFKELKTLKKAADILYKLANNQYKDNEEMAGNMVDSCRLIDEIIEEELTLYYEVNIMWEEHNEGLEFWPLKHNEFMQALEKRGWIKAKLLLFCEPEVFFNEFNINIKELTIEKYKKLQEKHPHKDIGEYCVFHWVLRPPSFYTLKELEYFKQTLMELK